MSQQPLEPYQRRLFLFLSVATFFEGYDFMAITQILPNLRADLGLSKAEGGLIISLISIGTILSYFLIRYADRWGRRRTLAVTIAGYTTATFFTALSPNVYAFVFFQFVARIFLLAEFATSMVYAAEEFPAARRGMVIGVIASCQAFGAIVCAAVVPVLLQAPGGWRAVYFVGVVPLLLLAVARRNLKETARFAETDRGAQGGHKLWHVLVGPHRKRVLQLGLLWALAYIGSSSALFFWKDFAVNERGLTDGDVGISVAIAAIVTLPLIFAVGKLTDIVGRKPAAVIIFFLGAAGVVGAFSFEDRSMLTVALCLALFGSSGGSVILNAYSTELFPTEIRADAYGWSNHLLGRIGYVVTPFIVAMVAETTGWAPAVRVIAIAPLIGLGIILWLFPETKGRPLEETAAV